MIGSERVVAKDINLDKMINPENSKLKVYWKKNIRIVLSLLAVWFFVSFGMGILLVDVLDHFRIFGFKLGFGWRNKVRFFVLLFLFLSMFIG